MATLFDHAVETVRNLPAERQEEIALLLLQLAGETGTPVIHLNPEEDASFDESFAQAADDEFSSEAEICAIWAKHGL